MRKVDAKYLLITLWGFFLSLSALGMLYGVLAAMVTQTMLPAIPACVGAALGLFYLIHQSLWGAE